MGIAVKDLLTMEYFKDFHVVAGEGGLHKEIQGVTLLEAPDATKWGRGKELILSSGYVMKQEPDCIRKSFENGSMLKTSAMMIKRGRYLDTIPEDMTSLFDAHDIPLISMPFSVPWMELMSQINTAVMNRTIRRFQIPSDYPPEQSRQSYKEQKIRRILKAVETEMHFPAFLYDLEEEKGYESSVNFRTISRSFHLEDADYWSPSLPFSEHTLCDYIHMKRFRLVNPDHSENARISWILIPIVVDNAVLAYFVVMESREFIDYYDEYAIRIAFLMLQSVYEQIVVMRNVGDVGFENFVHYVLTYRDENPEKLLSHANTQGISLDTPYRYIVFRQTNAAFNARNERKAFMDAFRKSRGKKYGKMAFLSENEGLLLLEAGNEKKEDAAEGGRLKELLLAFEKGIAERFPQMRFVFGISEEANSLKELVACTQKCRKVCDIGALIYPKEHIYSYDMLGPLAWLSIPKAELSALLANYRALMADEKNKETLFTLKMYLENKMNFSLTAEKMYANINTVRNRVEKANALLGIDLENHVERLKAVLLLQYLHFEPR